MSFSRPTLSTILTRVEADFVSRLALNGAVLRRAMVRILAQVIAGSEHMLHGHLEFLGRQLFPDQSEDAYLVRQASLYGLTKIAAGYATGTAGATGTNTTVIPTGSRLLNAAGAVYTVNADVTITLGVATPALTSELAGADYTLIAGQVLTFETPISGVDSTVTVAASTVDGTDEETTEALRVRLLARMSDPPMGGTEADYIAWAKEVAGVTRVWVYPLELGPGTVVVRFVRDNDGAAPANIPSAGEVTSVQTKLDTEAPVHATVTAAAPTDAPTAFTIAVVPNTTAQKALVQAELDDLYLRVAEPGRTMLLSELRTAIGATPGLTDYTLTTPAANVTHTTGQLPSRGTITWS